jgi:hypothetical protein
MVPTQLDLTEDQVNALRLLSVQRGTSLPELVRESIDLLLSQQVLREQARASLVQRALSASGKFRSGRHDISEKHDEYLAEAYED